MFIEYGGDGGRRKTVSFGNVGKCFGRIFKIFKDIGNSEDRNFLGLKDKRIVFVEGSPAAQAFISVGMISDHTGSAGNVGVFDLFYCCLFQTHMVKTAVLTMRSDIRQFNISTQYMIDSGG
jgi:hypothetical protein